ncbi:MAG: cyclopropane-fatty-acyl-phospholipid synthase family protein [Thermoanaerobaculia bacterium]|nr:cyclopropane-fatty-acyl-phospholipid synthase family protein [Thermoanaerobaculia bacterium]
MWYDPLLQGGLIPDALVRRKIRQLLRQRLADEKADDAEEALAREEKLVAEMRASPVALATAEANEQHYEVPPAFYELVLGAYRKYSSGLFSDGVTTLDAAEAAMLALTCERARLADGQNVLELGCGWGSLTLWMAERYPGSRIVAVSNSRDQREYIEARAAERNLANLKVVTCDMNVFDPATGPVFDRVVSVEMFEHMRNWPELLGRIASWMKPDGRLFLHVFSHRDVSYPYVARDESDWMARNFFTGGLMPSDHLLLRFPEHLFVEERWRVNGTHYARTAEAWLANLDRNEGAAKALFARTYGPGVARRKVLEWRIFFMACAELFAHRGGNEWMVSHYRLRRRTA